MKNNAKPQSKQIYLQATISFLSDKCFTSFNYLLIVFWNELVGSVFIVQFVIVLYRENKYRVIVSFCDHCLAIVEFYF